MEEGEVRFDGMGIAEAVEDQYSAIGSDFVEGIDFDADSGFGQDIDSDAGQDTDFDIDPDTDPGFAADENW